MVVIAMKVDAINCIKEYIPSTFSASDLMKQIIEYGRGKFSKFYTSKEKVKIVKILSIYACLG
jgi:hypothetical protein